MYLPQIDIAIEVNEPYHLKTQKRDRKRNSSIAKRLVAKVYTIDCSKPMTEVHARISEVVNEIRKRIIAKGEDFSPWLGLDEFRAKYHRAKDIMSVDEDYFENSDEICRAFNMPIKKRGWRRAGGSDVLRDGMTSLWWPIANNKVWKNEVSDGGRIIYEAKREKNGRASHVAKVKAGNQKRIVFFHDKDPVFGWRRYKFLGLYHLDKAKSRSKCVWVRDDSVVRISDYS